MNLLLIEDESRVADFIDRGLRAENYGVTAVRSGSKGLELAATGEFDVIILDLMLPDVHGFDICQRLRAANILTPILMLTAMDRVEDRIRGLKLGADDYLTKPFDFDELLARIEALVRRSNSFRGDIHILRVGDLVFDREKIEIHRGDERLILSAKELALLELLMSAPGKVFSRTRILNSVWGYDKDPLTNVVDVYIARLRKKLEVEGAQPLIETVRGYGYRIAERS
ncbi:transcriptional regulatory protein CusR [bacterium MnTg02]|nr:transcriptional regulatory protein CusR [bacterium MnTg02]